MALDMTTILQGTLQDGWNHSRQRKYRMGNNIKEWTSLDWSCSQWPPAEKGWRRISAELCPLGLLDDPPGQGTEMNCIIWQLPISTLSGFQNVFKCQRNWNNEAATIRRFTEIFKVCTNCAWVCASHTRTAPSMVNNTEGCYLQSSSMVNNTRVATYRILQWWTIQRVATYRVLQWWTIQGLLLIESFNGEQYKGCYLQVQLCK